jgi:hypothetical protein
MSSAEGGNILPAASQEIISTLQVKLSHFGNDYMYWSAALKCNGWISKCSLTSFKKSILEDIYEELRASPQISSYIALLPRELFREVRGSFNDSLLAALFRHLFSHDLSLLLTIFAQVGTFRSSSEVVRPFSVLEARASRQVPLAPLLHQTPICRYAGMWLRVLSLNFFFFCLSAPPSLIYHP